MTQVKYGCESLPQQYARFGRGQLPCDENGVIHWMFLNWGTDMDRYLQVMTIQAAFSEWAQHLFPIRFISTPHEQKAVWHVAWADDDDVINFPDGTKQDSPFKFRDNPSTIAVQYQSDPLLLILSDRWDYSLDAAGPNVINLWETATHEIGHGLQLGHTNHRKDIMYYQYILGNRISEDSVNGLYDFHGDQIRELAERLPHAKRFLTAMGRAQQELKHNKGCNPFGIF